MPRPPSGSSKRSKSVQGRRSKVGKSPYSSLQLKSSSKQQPPKPTARNMWITAMRNGTATLSTENSPIKTWGGSRASQNKQNKTGSRSRHLSDYVQIEDLKNKNHIRSASMSASEPQLSIGGPAYKPQEDYYDEIIELKKIINALKAENNILNTKLRRVEGENVLKVSSEYIDFIIMYLNQQQCTLLLLVIL
ncbi:IQ domain-containing protein E-like [Pocillopora damicornis]|uniref:IQ domain-containing protein E-like n=1 Tax=Pocillopora damicornis TaxID=46731 RepID=UPI000F54E829|nr:IQ domain-containing protein E-like [Pocillopora damicornis]